MATKFVKQATKTLDPLFKQQTQSLQSQIPAIEQLYNTLTQGLQQNTAQQIETGTMDITEDAARRGVLRSTLPVDARQNLQTTLQQALAQGMGQLTAQRAQQVGDIRSQISGLGLERVRGIQDLASTLQGMDLQERQFALQRAAAQQKASQPSASQQKSQLAQEAFSALSESWRAGKDGYVSPDQWNTFRSQWAQLGLSVKDFDNAFGHLVNPVHARRSDLKNYAGFTK